MWQLDVMSRNFGKSVIYVGSAGIIIEIAAAGVTVLSRPPDWKVYMFNRDAHLVNESTLAEFCRAHPTTRMRGEGIMKITRGTFKGIDADFVIYKYRAPYGDLVGTLAADRGALISDTYRYVYAHQSPASPQAIKVLNSTFTAMDYPQLFLQKEITCTNKEIIKPLVLISCSKSVPVPLAKLQIPKGFKPTGDYHRLFARVGEMEDMMKDLGVGDVFGKH